jgi:hypothetical protein
VDGVAVQGLFKLHFPPDLPPEIKIEQPGKGAVSLTNGNLTISARAYDPDGFLERVTVLLDGKVIATNSELSEINLQHQMVSPTGGIHSLAVIAEDSTGLVSTNEVIFTLVQTPPQPKLSIKSLADGWLALTHSPASGVRLQVSTDLQNWQDLSSNEAAEALAADGLTRTITLDHGRNEDKRFFRLVLQ